LLSLLNATVNNVTCI